METISFSKLLSRSAFEAAAPTLNFFCTYIRSAYEEINKQKCSTKEKASAKVLFATLVSLGMQISKRIKASRQKLMELASIGNPATFAKARNILVDSGYIKFVSGDGGNKFEPAHYVLTGGPNDSGEE